MELNKDLKQRLAFLLLRDEEDIASIIEEMGMDCYQELLEFRNLHLEIK